MRYERLKRQTWDEFEKERQGKKIFLFGCGKGVEYFFSIMDMTSVLKGWWIMTCANRKVLFLPMYMKYCRSVPLSLGSVLGNFEGVFG